MSHIIHRNPARIPPLAAQAQGCFLIDREGRRYYDASGGAAVSCLGHVHPEVLADMSAQLQRLEYAHTGAFTSAPAEALADLLAAQSPAGLGNAYFVSGGSEAVETALKLARQYQVARGQPQRYLTISRHQSYHGNTLGALAVGGHKGRRALYAPLLVESCHVSPCFAYRYQLAGESDDAYGDRLAQELEQTLLRVGPQHVSAFLAETVVGATAGAVAPVAGYFRKIKAVCERHGVLLILDEVMCGLGRSGSYHAFEQEGVTPDILCLAKGLGGGFQPIAAVLAQDHVVNTVTEGSGAFQHGFTYAGHPLACAAALAVQRIVVRDGLAQRSAELGAYLQARLRERFAEHPHVGDIRGRGLFQAIELVAERDRAQPFAPGLQLHARIKEEGAARGLLCYPGGGTIDGEQGDHVLLAPPYITSREELDMAVDLLGQAVDAAIARVGAAPAPHA